MPNLTPESVELRIAVFRVTEIAFPPKTDRMSFFIRVILMDDDGTEHKGETDTHYYAFANEALAVFNWRLLFPIEIPRSTCHARVQLCADDKMIGSASVWGEMWYVIFDHSLEK